MKSTTTSSQIESRASERASLSDWWQFTRERFDPASHLIMILLFVIAHRLLFGPSEGESTWIPVVAVFVATVAFFFKLRLYDEIKDYELDQVINPTRPLARGLVTHADLHRGIIACIAFELVIFGTQGLGGLITIAIAIGYSLLMYKEFFIRERIRPHLTTYAVSHTIVSGMLSLALIAAFTRRFPWELDSKAWLFALNSWCLFNIFEFGRKTFASAEERGNVESYSKIFGRLGAVILVMSQAVASTCFLIRMTYGTSVQSATAGALYLFTVGATFLLLAAGVIYVVANRPAYARMYRAFSSIYIVLIYAGLLSIRLIT